MIFNRKKKIERASKEVKDDNWEEVSIPVFFAGEETGRVFKIVGKEVGGLDMLNVWMVINKGAAIESRIIDVIKKQGLYLGLPLKNLDDT